ncbi:MAG: NAD-binding protein [Chloroflexota bacterium]
MFSLSKEFKKLILKFSIAFLIIIFIVISQGIILYWAEDLDGPFDGIYKNIISIGGETASPSSTIGRIITVFAVIEGLILGAYIVVLTAVFSLQGGSILEKKLKDHSVICGWNFQGQRIVKTLLNTQKNDIVIINNSKNELKFDSKRVRVINGDPTTDATLDRANIINANTAIILTDLSLNPLEADSRSLLIVLAIESKNSAVYTCAQLIDSSNNIHMQRANVDEVILLDVIGADLAAASVMNKGSSRILSELVRYDQGSEIYRYDPPLPKKIIGEKAQIASDILHEQRVILIAVETSDEEKIPKDFPNYEVVHKEFMSTGRAILVNPVKYEIGKNDSIFVISKDDPEDALSKLN